MVGLGRIGYQVARRTAGFDMDILSTNRNRNERAEWDLGVRYRPSTSCWNSPTSSP